MRPAPGVSLESLGEQEITWYEPPQYLTVDVNRTIREGRVIAADVQSAFALSSGGAGPYF
jgi:hypothetical protein